jgi:DNA-3-methyladenine glycosylase II
MTPEAMEFLRRADKVLGRLIQRIGPCTLKPKRRSPFRALVQAVTYQQLNGTAAETIFRRFKALLSRSPEVRGG